MNISKGNATHNNIARQNSTENALELSSSSQMSSAVVNNTGMLTQSNKMNNQVSSNLIFLQNMAANITGNTSERGIPTRLVLTPETNPLYPPGYGYPVMPGLIRIWQQRPKNSTKIKKPMVRSPADQERRISKYALYYCYLALATFVCSYGQMVCWNIASSKFFQEKQNQCDKLGEEGLDNDKRNKRLEEE